MAVLYTLKSLVALTALTTLTVTLYTPVTTAVERVNFTVADFSEMDVIIQYTDTSDNLTLTYLGYNAGGLDDNEWTVAVTGVQPDSFNPRMWDSDEELTVDLRVSPAIKAGTTAFVVVATPWGVNDQSSITNP